MTWEQRLRALAGLDGDGDVAERLELPWRSALHRCIRRDCRSPGLAAGGCRDVAGRDWRRGIHRPCEHKSPRRSCIRHGLH